MFQHTSNAHKDSVMLQVCKNDISNVICCTDLPPQGGHKYVCWVVTSRAQHGAGRGRMAGETRGSKDAKLSRDNGCVCMAADVFSVASLD